MEIMIVVGLTAFLAVYAGLEMSRKAVDNDVARMRTHISYITAGMDRLYSTTGSIAAADLASISTLCDGNYILPSICVGSTTNTSGSGGFSGLSVDPVYTAVGTGTTTATVTIAIANSDIAKALNESLNDQPIQGVTASALSGDADPKEDVTITFAAGTA